MLHFSAVELKPVGRYPRTPAVRRVLEITFASSLLTAVGCDDSSEGAEQSPPEEVRYRVTIDHVAAPGTLQPSMGEPLDIIIAPGLWAVHEDGEGILHVGEPASSTVERMAEDGDHGALLDEMRETAASVGIFGAENVDDNYATAPLGPGDSTSFELDGMSNQRLSMVGMFIHSNDVLYATIPGGIALDSLEPGGSEQMSSSIALFDVGTEQNEEPGIGPSQPMQSMEHDVGEPEMGVITRIDGQDAAGYDYPAVSDFLRLTVERLE